MLKSNVALIRQFARAVLADRLIGDELTRLAVAKTAIDPQADPDDPRDLMRAFLRSWRSAAANQSGSSAMFSDRALLQALPPPPSEERLMLLFVDVIGFTLEEAGDILAPMATDPARALTEGRKLVDEARRATSIIIEDEPLIAAELKMLLEKMGVKVGGSATTAAQAVSLANKVQPDLILADYNLEDGETGADAVAKIVQSHDCPIIFITGFPDKVLRGEEIEPDFVIAKPYRLETIRAAVAHCIDTRATAYGTSS